MLTVSFVVPILCYGNISVYRYITYAMRAWTLEPDDLGSNPVSATYSCVSWQIGEDDSTFLRVLERDKRIKYITCPELGLV